MSTKTGALQVAALTCSGVKPSIFSGFPDNTVSRPRKNMSNSLSNSSSLKRQAFVRNSVGGRDAIMCESIRAETSAVWTPCFYSHSSGEVGVLASRTSVKPNVE